MAVCRSAPATPGLIKKNLPSSKIYAYLLCNWLFFVLFCCVCPLPYNIFEFTFPSTGLCDSIFSLTLFYNWPLYDFPPNWNCMTGHYRCTGLCDKLSSLDPGKWPDILPGHCCLTEYPPWTLLNYIMSSLDFIVLLDIFFLDWNCMSGHYRWICFCD